MKNILVSIDFEKNASLLIDRAVETAVQFDAKIWLVHIAAPDPDFVGYEVGPQVVRDVRAKELKEERIMLEKYAQRIQELGIDSQSLLVEGPTVESILKITEKLDIDLVVIGHHKRNLFLKALVGNTDTALINRSKVPVLIVPLQNSYYSKEVFFQAEEIVEEV